jgi:hypothetical protein
LTGRPWIEAKVDLDGALSFTPTECSAILKLTMRNVGSAPAMKVRYFAALCATVTAAIACQKEMIDAAQSTAADATYGETIFPNAIRTESLPRSILNAELEEALSKEGEIRPIIVVCVYYGLPTGGRFRYTNLILEIIRKESNAVFDGMPATFGLDQIELIQLAIGETS